jgi:hypothetical protein
MGTRHFQKVIDKDGVERVRQYGQWDGYLSGQGLDILNFLKTADLEKYQENLSKLQFITNAEIDALDDKTWAETHPHLSRDCGAKIHSMIERGLVEKVRNTSEDEANQWCEGFYTIDFQKGTFSFEYHDSKNTYSLDNLPSEKEFLNQ